MTSRAAALVAASLALLLLPAVGHAAGWDPTPLPLSPSSDASPQLGPLVEMTDDGAAWVMWADDPDQNNQFDVAVRRIGPDGVPGERRVLTTTDPSYYGAIGLAPLPGGDVRVAYTSAMGAVLEERRLTPTGTGDPVVLYDKATTDKGNVSAVSVRVLSAPDGASWVSFVLPNNGTSIVNARRIAGDDGVSDTATLTQSAYEYGAAVDPTGRLMVAVTSGGQGRMVLVPVDTDASIGSELEIRPVFGSGAASNTPEIAIDASGIATVGWRLDVFASSARYIEARRVDTTTMTPAGSGATALNDDLPASFVMYGPLFGVDPGGAAVMGWYETDSFTNNDDAMVRVLGAGAFADTGVIGSRLRLDGPPPEGANVSDLVPAGGGIVAAFFYNHDRRCGAPRIDTASGTVVSDDVIAETGCAAPAGPASGENGIAAAWTNYPGWQVMVKRYVTDPPACSDGAATTVAAGASVTLALPCTGWRPHLETVGAPARGAVGGVDQDARTVTYTAGSEGGADQVRFRATNGAGASSERSIAITVTAPPVMNPPPDASDHTAPVLSGLSLKPRHLRLRKLRAPSLAFTLSEAATVNATVQRLVDGRRRGGRCVTRPRPRRGRRCVKATTVKRLSAVLPAGAASLRIALRKPLKPGRYRVVVTATDAAGNTSKALRVSLTITRR